jgi:CubicO group peptidase (beta-lactamase class C family)
MSDVVVETNPFQLCGGFSQLNNNHIFKPSISPLKLHYEPNIKLHDQCEMIFNNSLTLSLILFDNGKIVYERYRKPSSKSTPIFTWSISKSLVAWLVGYIIDDVCNPLRLHTTLFNNNNEKINETQIEKFLTMSSGFRLENECYSASLFSKLKNYDMSQIELFSENIINVFEPGSSFLYNNMDTQMLVHVTNNEDDWFKLFQHFIINPSRLKKQSYWLHDKAKFPIGMAGYSATSRDMLRLAIRFTEVIQNKKYFQNMIKPQILNYPKTNGFQFKYYGYQTWCSDSSFWWLGMGGQRVGIDINNNKILITSRFGEFQIGHIYKLFKFFQQT